jgi:hypothetical protein
LREIVGGLQCCEGKLRHLGVESAPVRSTLSYANGRRPWQLFEQLFYQLIDTCRGVAPGKKFRFKNKLLSLDSTIIELCVTMFDWARFQKTKGAVKLHLLLDHDGYLPTYALLTEGRTADLTVAQGLDLPKGSVVVIDRGYNDYLMFERWCAEGVFFVTRLKDNAYYIVSERCPVPERSTILADELIVFQAFHRRSRRNLYPPCKRQYHHCAIPDRKFPSQSCRRCCGRHKWLCRGASRPDVRPE